MNLQKKIKDSSMEAKEWFENNAHSFTREDFLKSGSLSATDNKNGAVYVYFRKNKALYVGETGRGVKERLYVQTSKHTEAEWWTKWTSMQFLPVTDKTDGLLLELLLILAYAPEFNKKPGARKFSSLFVNQKSK